MKYKIQEEQDVNIVSEPSVAYGFAQNANAPYYVINQINRGISFVAFEDIVKQSPFSILEWSSFLHLTDRTILRYKTDRKSFEGIYAEKIIEISMLVKKGLDTFSTKEKLNKWLHATSIALGGYEPIQLLNTSIGIDLVTQELIRIDYGILA